MLLTCGTSSSFQAVFMWCHCCEGQMSLLCRNVVTLTIFKFSLKTCKVPLAQTVRLEYLILLVGTAVSSHDRKIISVRVFFFPLQSFFSAFLEVFKATWSNLEQRVEGVTGWNWMIFRSLLAQTIPGLGADSQYLSSCGILSITGCIQKVIQELPLV